MKKTSNIILLFFILATCFPTSTTYAQRAGQAIQFGEVDAYVSGGTWATKTPIPTKRYFASSKIVNNIIYVIGGYDNAYYSTNEAYDPAADTWSTKASMTYAREDCANGVVNGKIYVMGGGTTNPQLKFVEEYDPVGDTWVTKTPMPMDFSSGASATVNGKIYLIGGIITGGPLDRVVEYDPLTESWTTKTSMPTARRYIDASASIVNNKIYVFGGTDGVGLLSTVEMYDPGNDTWASKTSMPSARHSVFSATVNNKIYVIGGFDSSGPTNLVEEYDPATDTWTNCGGSCAAMPTPRGALYGAVFNGKIYAISGQIAGAGYTMTNAVEEYTPPDFDSLSEGLVAYYPFNGNANDESGNGNDGTVNGATLTTDRFGNANSAYSFDGVDDYIKVSYDPSLYPQSTALSLWINPSSTGTRSAGIISNIGAGTDPPYDPLQIALLISQQVQCTFAGDNDASSIQLTSKTVLNIDKWYHISAYYDEVSGNAALFINGIKEDSATVLMQLSTNNLGLILGSEQLSTGSPNPEWHFPGLIDDIRIYNRALTESEIDSLYHLGGWDPVTFTRITTGPAVSDGGQSIGASWGDYDNDGDLDLFVANNGENNFLYANNGDGTFTKVTTGPPVSDGGNSNGASWGDYENDGDLDLFVTNNGENNFLYTNNGDGTFTKVTTGPLVTDGGQSIGASWGDYDNDGDLDLFVANDKGDDFLYSNNGDGTFTSVAAALPVTDGGNSYGASWGDYDNDGDLDLFVARIHNQNNFLYANNGNANHWINLQLVGTESNVSAIGAKVRLKAIIFGAPLLQLRELSGQTGSGGQNSLNAEFGLGDATIIDSIKIEWPSGIVQVLTNQAVDQFLTIMEPHPTLSQGLVAYYPFNGNANDESGNGNNGTVYGATLTTDRFGNENSTYSFDGVDDYIDIPYSEYQQPQTISISCWVNEESIPDEFHSILAANGGGDAGVDDPYVIGITDSGNVRAVFEGLQQTTTLTLFSENPLSLNQWHNIVAIFDDEKDSALLYINGILNDEGYESMLTLDQNTLGIKVGTYQLGSGAPLLEYCFQGKIDDIRIYNRALTESEIDSLYHLGGWDPVTFTRITEGDIVNDGGQSHSSSWGDYDNDGDLDLFVANLGGENNFLYQNNGDGSFTKITTGQIVNDGGGSMSASWGDYDNDGDLDLFVANYNNESNFLYANNGDGTFTKVNTAPVVTDGGESLGASWGDYDNDGDLDLFVANYNQNNFLYANNGDGTFTKVTTGPLVTEGVTPPALPGVTTTTTGTWTYSWQTIILKTTSCTPTTGTAPSPK